MQQIGGLATAFSEHPLSANTARLIQDDLRIRHHDSSTAMVSEGGVSRTLPLTTAWRK